jgi:hypothetical protein
MNNLWKNFKALQNFSHYKDARLKVLSDDLFTFSQELQNLYDHIKNHTLPNGGLNSTNEYLKHIKKLGEKLKECQSLNDVLEECQSKI